MNPPVDKQKIKEYFPWALTVALLAQGHLYVDLVPQDGIIKGDSERQLEDARNGDKIKTLIQSTLEEVTIVRVQCSSNLSSNELSFRVAQAITDRRRHQERLVVQAAIRARQSRITTTRDGSKVLPRPSRNRRQTAGLRSNGGGYSNTSNLGGIGPVWLGNKTSDGKRNDSRSPTYDTGLTDKSVFSSVSNDALHSSDINRSPGRISHNNLDSNTSASPSRLNPGSTSTATGNQDAENELISIPESYVLLVEGIELAPMETLRMLQDLIRNRSFHVPVSEGDGDAAATGNIISYMKVMLPSHFVVIATSSACCTPISLSQNQASPADSSNAAVSYHLPYRFLSEFLLRIPVDVSQLAEIGTEAENTSSKHQRFPEAGDIKSKRWLVRLGRSLSWVDTKRLVQTCQRMHMTQLVRSHLRDMISALRHHPMVVQGPDLAVSAGALTRAIVACAALRGRSYVVPRDLISIALETLSHLVILQRDCSLEGLSRASEPPSCFLEPPQDWHHMVLARFVVHQTYEFYLPVVR